MSEEQDQVTHARTQTSKKILLLTFPIKIAWGVFKLMLWVLGIYLAVYFVVWAIGGFESAYMLLQHNYDYLAIRINQYSDNSLIFSTFQWLSHGIQSATTQTMGWLGSLPNNQNLASSVDNGIDAYRALGVKGSTGSLILSSTGFAQNAVIIIAMALLISLMKLVTSLSLVVMYFLGIVLGILTGNRKRLYRRLGIDRESDAKYRLVKFLVSYLPLCVIVVYMVLPFNLNPLLVFFIIGLISVVLFYTMLSRFKKYL
ncbi:MAG: DUF4400 domain-containing protein [Proteobacteria bacterium]|nr:DUF4400 domain-containing protein [Pseudomonadota bacterium]